LLAGVPVPVYATGTGMLVKYGSFAKPASTTGNQSVTGVGFQPKLVMFFGNGLTADGTTTGAQEFFGAAVSAASGAVIADAVLDNALNHGSKRFSNALVITHITPNNATPTVVAEASFVTMGADGFTINWTTCDASQRIVNYIALAGDDLTNVDVGSFTAPTSAGDKAVTGVGFQPDALILFDNAVTTTPIAVGNSKNPSFNMGFIVGTSQQVNRTTTRASDEAAGNWMYQRTDSAENSVDKTGAVVRTSTIKSMDADGFTLTFSVAAANAVYLNYIALKGGQYKTGSFNQATTTGNQSVTGVGFQPDGVLFQSSNTGASLVATTPSRLSFGIGVSAAEQGSMWSGVANGLTAVADSDLDRTACLKMWTEGTPTLNAEMDFVSNDADGFTVNNTTADATSRQVLYFAFGDTDVAPPVPSSFDPASTSAISDPTQTITFTTDEEATCRVSLTDQAYADMSVACDGAGTTSQSCTTPDLGANGAKTVYIACTDGTNADTAGTNEHLSYTLTLADTTPPAPSGFSPASVSVIGDPTQTIAFTTDENATCRVSLTDQAYGDMSVACRGAGSTSQACTSSDLGADGAKNVYIACTDGTNADTADTNENLTYTLNTVSSMINLHLENDAGILNSGSGGSVYDSAFTGNAAYSATAKVGSYGASFDRTADYIDLKWGSGASPRTQSFSAMFWVQESVACPSGTDNHVFGTGDIGTTGTRWYVRCRANTWRFRVGALTEVNSAVAVTLNTWYHLAIVGDASTDVVTFYVNGVSKGTASMTSDFTLRGNLFLGNFNDASGTYAEGSNGIFDEFSLYTRVLTSSEVLAAYNAPSIPNVPTGLAATPYDGRVKLAWTAPTATDQAVTDYKIEYKEHSAGSYSTFAHAASTETTTFVTSLTNATAYDFRVSAVNAAGTGSSTDAVSATPYTMMTYNGATPADTATFTGSSLTISVGSTVQSGSLFTFNLLQGEETVQTSSTARRTGDYNTDNLVQTQAVTNLSLISNTSGVTYAPASNTLFVVHNDPPTIDELTLTGALIRSITCTGANCTSPGADSEGLEWLSSAATEGGYNHTFMISTERVSRLYRVTIGPSTTTFDTTDTFPLYVNGVALGDQGNSGLEGVAYDSVHDVYYAVKEISPMKIYSIHLGNGSGAVTEICNAPVLLSGIATDIADLDYEASTGYLYLLSQESENVITVDISNPSSCSVVRTMSVAAMTQAEGVSFDDRGEYLYVDGEADELSVFRTTNYSASHTFTGIADGTYTYNVTLRDTLGVDTTIASRTVTISATPPVPSSFNPASASTIADATPTITFSLNENGDCKISLTDQAYNDMTTDCSGDGTQSMSCTAPDLGADGAKTVYIACKDSSGARDTADTNEALTFTLNTDSSPPAPSGFSPASTSTITDVTQTITFTTDENATCRVSLTDQAYGDMSVTCTGGGTTSQSCTTPDLGANGAKTVYIACTDGTNADTVATNEAISYMLDTSGPSITDIETDATSSSATIAWNTDEAASTRLLWGLTSVPGTLTDETNTETRLSAHEVELTGLTACTSYYAYPLSTDASGYSATGSLTRFTTTGCTNSADVKSQTGSAIATGGGSLSMTGGGSGASLTVPADASTNSFTLQIKKLDTDVVIAATSTPSGVSVVGDLTFDFRAVSGSTLVSSFLEPITVTMAYTDAQVSGYDESSLWMYRWDGSAWSALDSCTVDTAANTVTCTTTHFSTFGLFGETETTGGSTSTPSTSTTTSQSTGGGRGGDTAARIQAALERIQGRAVVSSPDSATHEAATEPALSVGSQVGSDVSLTEMGQRRNRFVAMVGGQVVLYRDVPLDAWYSPFVEYVVTEEIAVGYRDEEGEPTGEFGVQNPVTFAEVLKMALEASDADLQGVPPPRNTSAQSTWASAYVAKAEAMQLSVFSPDLDVTEPATRGAVIQTILEALDIPLAQQPPAFSDVPANHPNAFAIATAAFYGLISGDKDASGNALHTFRPDEPINRAEAAKIIAVALELNR